MHILVIKSAQIKILLNPQFEHKQEPAEDQSEGGRPRDGGHSQPYTGDISSDLHHNVIIRHVLIPGSGGRVLPAKAKLVRLQTQD